MGWALNAEKCISFLWAAVLIGKFTPFVFFLSIIFCQWMHLKAVGIASSFIVAVWCGIYGATILQMQKNALAFALRKMRFCATHSSECILAFINKWKHERLPSMKLYNCTLVHPYLHGASVPEWMAFILFLDVLYFLLVNIKRKAFHWKSDRKNKKDVKFSWKATIYS